MGLSSAPNNDISSLQLIADFAQTLQKLQPVINDPKALAQFVEDAYALPEKQAAKNQEALDNIGKYQELVAENNTQLDDIEKLHAELDDKTAALNKRTADLNGLKSSLDSQQNSLNAQADSLKQREKDLAQGLTDLASGNAKLAQDNADLAAQRQALANDAADLKDREKKLADIIGGK